MSEHWERIGKPAPNASCPASAAIVNAQAACVGAAAGIASRG